VIDMPGGCADDVSLRSRHKTCWNATNGRVIKRDVKGKHVDRGDHAVVAAAVDSASFGSQLELAHERIVHLQTRQARHNANASASQTHIASLLRVLMLVVVVGDR